MRNRKSASMIQLVILAVLLLSPVAALPVLAQEQQEPAQPQEGGGEAPDIQADVDVDVEREGESTTTTWYANPVWIVAGLAVLILLILIIVLATRRGEKTTVIKS